jgi:hypothetical protein
VHHERKWTTRALPVWCPVRPAILRSLAVGRRPGQRQHVKIEAAGLTLAPFLPGGTIRTDGCEAGGNGYDMSPPARATTHRRLYQMPSSTGHENKSEIDVTQRFPCKDTVSLERFKNKRG